MNTTSTIGFWNLTAVLVLGVLIAGSPAEATPPVAVSPGATTEVLPVEQRCPTFSWGAARGARGYELVVLRVPPAGGEGHPEEVFRHRFDALVLSWTPSLGRCLEPGGTYAWSVRGIGSEGPGPWAEAKLFEIDERGSEERLREAVHAVLRGLAAEGRIGAVEAAGLEEIIRQAGAAQGEARASPAALPRGFSATTLDGVVAAIRGQLQDNSGEAFGVVGVSHSAAGAGLAAENTAGGPDLLLAGDPPAALTEVGLSRASAGPVSFDFANPGAGTMTLTIDSATVLTTATTGVFLPLGSALSCASTQKVVGISGSTGDVVCGLDLTYTDAEAVAAMGPKADANPLHHDRYTDAEAITAGANSKMVMTSCPTGYTLIVDNLCITGWRDPLPFYDAQAQCAEEGAHVCTYAEFHWMWHLAGQNPFFLTGDWIGDVVDNDTVLCVDNTSNSSNFEGTCNKGSSQAYRCCMGRGR